MSTLFISQHQHANNVINDKMRCSHSVHTLIIIPGARLVTKTQKKWCTMETSPAVILVLWRCDGLGNAVGALPKDPTVSCVRCGAPLGCLGQCCQQNYLFSAERLHVWPMYFCSYFRNLYREVDSTMQPSMGQWWRQARSRGEAFGG